MKRGRPEVTEQTKLYKALQTRFERGESIAYAAREEKVNIKTVQNYYREFREKMVEQTDQDFINRQKIAKEFALAGLDEDLQKLRTQFDELVQLCEDDPENSAWQSIRLQVTAKMAELKQQKADLEMSPTLDVSLEQMVEERLNDEEHSSTASQAAGKGT